MWSITLCSCVALTGIANAWAVVERSTCDRCVPSHPFTMTLWQALPTVEEACHDAASYIPSNLAGVIAVPLCNRVVRGNGRCTCMERDHRCLTIKPFFEGALRGCKGTKKECVSNPYGYRSCERISGKCQVNMCWAWTVEVMTECPQFSKNLGVCP